MLIFDIETDGFLDVCTVVHCLHVHDVTTGRSYRFSSGVYADGSPAERDGSVADGVAMLEAAESIGGHNIIRFDIPALDKLVGFKPRGKILDTMVVSRLIWSNMREIDVKAMAAKRRPPEFNGKHIGAHSLEAWGLRLGCHKGSFEGPFDNFTREMDDYCAQDVVVNVQIYERIQKMRAENVVSDQAIEIEMRVAELISQQEARGFWFNVPAAERLASELMQERARLEDELRVAFKPWIEPVRKGGRPLVTTPKTNNKRHGHVKDCPFTKVQTVVFNPASRDHIANRLSKLYGWVPQDFTDGGKPKVDETTLDGLDYPEVKLLVRYLTVVKRLGQLAEGDKAWLKVVGPDSRIHGAVNPMGAVTGRMTHFAPNLAQVPACGALWGSECRDLFGAGPGLKLMGCDAEGLELRMLGHYAWPYDDGDYARSVVDGKKEDQTDVHNVNRKAVGLNSRDSAKTFIYALCYGAGDYKIGGIVLDDMTEQARAFFYRKYPDKRKREEAIVRLGRKARANIMDALPALKQLTDDVKRAHKRGYLLGLDRRRIPTRSEHAALNTLLQGGGAVVMKVALIRFVDRMAEAGLQLGTHFWLVANVHDEFQVECLPEIAEQAGEIAKAAITEAGVELGVRCPLAGSAAIGNTWKDTH